MLRLTFVWILLIVGLACALWSTFNSLLFYLWIAYFRPQEWVWTWKLRALDISWWAGILLVSRAVFSREVYRIDARLLLLLLFLLHTFVSTLISDYRAFAWPWWTDFVKMIVITYVLATLPTDSRKLRMVLVVIVLSLGFEATKQGYAGLLLNPGGKNWNEIKFLGDENGVAIGMLMLVPVIAALAGTATRQWEKRLFQFILIGVLYRAIVTYSRGGFVGCVALAVIYLARSKQRFRSLVGIAVVSGIILPVLPDAFWDRMNTITLEEEEMDVSSKGRLHFWEVAVEMAKDRPFVGVGYNAFNAAFDDYDFLHGAMGTGKNHHSIWFGTVAELGFPGLLLFAANLFLAIRACRRVRKMALRGLAPPEIGRYALALEAALWVPPIGGAFVAFQYSEMLWHYFGLTIALETIAARQEIEPVAAHPAGQGAAPAEGRKISALAAYSPTRGAA